MNTAGDYCNKVSLEKRKEITSYAKEKFPGKLPIIVEYERNFPDDKRIPKFKFLVPKNFRMLDFTSVLRNKMNLSSKSGLFIFVGDTSKGGTLVRQGDFISTVHENYSHQDGFLYLVISLENVYG